MLERARNSLVPRKGTKKIFGAISISATAEAESKLLLCLLPSLSTEDGAAKYATRLRFIHHNDDDTFAKELDLRGRPSHLNVHKTDLLCDNLCVPHVKLRLCIGIDN
ncbi:unnamed protein product [Ceratitis capitata]|uniref:(Mediterranean fruit fly) hypothetical protein n=1 Tax=Ceratitis capitata TaxID=7213 RepID=A0A811U8G3_CERCA|nr:unnamed protein product [Ceratitis capitata]